MVEKELNLFVEFQKNSGDFLKVLGELSMKAQSRRPVTIQTKDFSDMVSVIELFWDVTEKIFLKYEERMILLRMTSATEHAKAVILSNELRDTYNEMFKVRDKIPDVFIDRLKSTVLPKKDDFEKEVILKNKPQQ